MVDDIKNNRYILIFFAQIIFYFEKTDGNFIIFSVPPKEVDMFVWDRFARRSF